MANRRAIYWDGSYKQCNTTTDVIEAYGFSGKGNTLTNVNAVTLGTFSVAQFLRSDVADIAGGAITFQGFSGSKLIVQATAADETTTSVKIVDIKSSAGGSMASIDSEGDMIVRDLQVNGVETVVSSISAASLTLSGALTVNGATTLGNGDDVVIVNSGAGNAFSVTASNVTLSAAGALAGLASVSATTIGGIAEANLVDKSAVESITGAWTFNDINLNNLFKINSVATSTNVTAANLNTLTGGANADALHSHTVVTGNQTITLTNNGVAQIVAKKPVYSNGANTIAVADAAAIETARVIGITDAAIDAAASGSVSTSGKITGALVAATAGAPVYLAVGGGYTQTAPSASGQVVLQIGLAYNATDIKIAIGEPLVLA